MKAKMMMMIIVLCCHIRIPAEAKCSRFKNSLHSKDCFDEEGGDDDGDDDGDSNGDVDGDEEQEEEDGAYRLES